MTTRLHLPKLEATPEHAYLNRRAFLRSLGLGAAALMAGFPAGCGAASTTDHRAALLEPGLDRPDVLKLFPARRNSGFQVPGDLTDAAVAGSYNNFYEFTTAKDQVWKLAQQFEPDPWSIQVTGLCRKPATFSIDDVFAQFGRDQEERTYRFRCVEAWAMDVPWTGFELNRLLEAVEPRSDAKFVRFVTVNRPAQMPGIESQPWYPWPYFEALRMDEAMNELTMLVTGVYGRPLPRQHGAPFRIIVPWKYGYKSPKSIVKIELVAEQPNTFWESLQPKEYPFLSNVNPDVPHPRWSQAEERMIGSGETRPTRLYNGYAEQVAHLYG